VQPAKPAKKTLCIPRVKMWIHVGESQITYLLFSDKKDIIFNKNMITRPKNLKK